MTPVDPLSPAEKTQYEYCRYPDCTCPHRGPCAPEVSERRSCFVCPECGPRVGADEDDCCRMCGADTTKAPTEERQTTDAIVTAADAAKAFCIHRIQRAIRAAKGLMPLTAEECVTILENSNWEEELRAEERRT